MTRPAERRFVPLARFALAMALVAPPVSAQGDVAPPISEVVDVTLLELEVQVTGHDGAPVQGLVASDFRVTADKQKLPITHFAEVHRESHPDQLATLVVFVDERNLRPGNRRQLLLHILPEVVALMDGARLGATVVAWDGDFRVVQELTYNSELVASAIEELAAREGGGSPLESLHTGTRNSVESVLAQARSQNRDRVAIQTQFEGLAAEFRSYTQAVHEEVERALGGLRSVIWSLGQVEGRKGLLYLSDGVAMRPLDELLATMQSLLAGTVRSEDTITQASGGSQGASSGGTFGDSGRGVFSRDVSMPLVRMMQGIEPFNSTQVVEELIAEANAYRVSIYPIKAPPGDTMAAEASGKGEASQQLSDLRQSLHMLAEGTGGRAHTTETDVTGFVRSLESDFEHYYSIGVTPLAGAAAGDGTQLEVKCKRCGTLRYGNDHVVKSRRVRLAESTYGSLLVGRGLNYHQLEVNAAAPVAAEDGRFDVDLQLELPISLIGLQEPVKDPGTGDGVRRAAVDLAVVVLSSDHQMLAASQAELPLEIPVADVAASRSSYYRASVVLRLPAGSHRLGVSLWDRVRRLSTFLEEDLTVVPP